MQFKESLSRAIPKGDIRCLTTRSTLAEFCEVPGLVVQFDVEELRANVAVLHQGHLASLIRSVRCRPAGTCHTIALRIVFASPVVNAEEVGRYVRSATIRCIQRRVAVFTEEALRRAGPGVWGADTPATRCD
mgnify:CR=1 FL=1